MMMICTFFCLVGMTEGENGGCDGNVKLNLYAKAARRSELEGYLVLHAIPSE